MSRPTKILWLTWKDQFHPEAGGAEVVCREITKRLVADGHSVTMLTSGYGDAVHQEIVQGINTIRVGMNRYTHPFQALNYYVRNLRNKFDVVIEEVNAAPYFSTLIESRARRFVLYHQLERKNWFFETKPPLSHIGHYLLEPVASRILSLAHVPVITVSESTRRDLVRHGFPAQRTHIISEGLEIEHATDINTIKKYDQPTILSLGSMRAMKRTLDQVKAFEYAKQQLPNLQMKIAGSASSDYGQKVLAYIKNSPYAADIEYMGRVSTEGKIDLMRKCHVITVTSVKEGWGLIVTEAASQGTPAVVYNIDGLRDSVRHQKTGLVTAENPEALAKSIVELITDKQLYEKLRRSAYEWSKEITFDRSYQDFVRIIGQEKVEGATV